MSTFQLEFDFGQRWTKADRLVVVHHLTEPWWMVLDKVGKRVPGCPLTASSDEAMTWAERNLGVKPYVWPAEWGWVVGADYKTPTGATNGH
jgi:hypothetical protein